MNPDFVSDVLQFLDSFGFQFVVLICHYVGGHQEKKTGLLR
jgi:hypothetical protein